MENCFSSVAFNPKIVLPLLKMADQLLTNGQFTLRFDSYFSFVKAINGLVERKINFNGMVRGDRPTALFNNFLQKKIDNKEGTSSIFAEKEDKIYFKKACPIRVSFLFSPYMYI